MVEDEAGGLRYVDGLVRRPREVVGDTGDPSFLLDEVFRGGVDGRTGGWEDLGDLGDGSRGGSFSCHSNLVPQCRVLVIAGVYLDNGWLVWRI